MTKIRKNYRFSPEVIEKLARLAQDRFTTETEILENLVMGVEETPVATNAVIRNTNLTSNT